MYGVAIMIEFEIDHQKVSAPDGAMIIEAADAAGIYIPRFCYHKKLSIAANCRMCLVEVEGGRKPLPACATPATQDMKVFTTSKTALDSQRIVMQFLLANHPLDCPICDQGGECELQDLAMGYGSSHSDYDQPKRAVASEDIGPLIETEMTRCIHCTRCVRFGEEVAGLRELGVTSRGGDAEIGTYVKHFLKSELSGNIIDLCPVGALTAKPSRYSERAWELKEHANIAAHDCVGSNIYINTRGQEYAPQRVTMRVTSRECEAINEVWISDRDRFSYEGLKHVDRALQPRMKKNGMWETVEWKYALMAIADRLSALVQHQSAQQIAALVSPNSTVEECYLMQKLLRGLGSHHIDHRLRELDFSDQENAPAFPNLGVDIEALEDLDAVLLVGSNIRFEQPLLANRLTKAAADEAAIMAVNPIDYKFIFKLQHKLVDVDLVQRLAEVARAAADLAGCSFEALAEIQPSDTAQAIARTLKDGERAYVMLGDTAMQHPHAAVLRQLVRMICECCDTRIGVVTDGANSSGAWLAGAVPHRDVAVAVKSSGLNAKQLLTTDPVRAYFLLDVDPAQDTAYPEAALKTLEDAGCVVAMTAFETEAMQDYADFILPIAPFSEKAGTFVNIDGKWQSFKAASVPHGDARSAWKILRVLANFLELDGFDFDSAQAVSEAVKAQVANIPDFVAKDISLKTLPAPVTAPVRLATPHMYRVDNLVRRASALQACIDETADAVSVNAKTAEQLGVASAGRVTVTQGAQEIEMPLVINDRLADHVVLLPAAFESTAGFGAAWEAIQLS